MDKLFWFVLSKDRPLQLDALLRSMKTMLSTTSDCVVLYKASNERYRMAYAEVFERHKTMPMDGVPEQHFKNDVVDIVRSRTHERVAFLVDDLVFIAPVDVEQILTLDPTVMTYSLRLGKRVTFSQPLGITTNHPPFLSLDGLPATWLAWHWGDGRGDWHGPNCLDGNVLSRGMVQAALEQPLAAKIAGPQSLEMALNSSGIATRIGICDVEPQVVNLAFNRVSEESQWYPHGTLDADKMLGAWQSGYQLNLGAPGAFETNACHLICDLPLQRR